MVPPTPRAHLHGVHRHLSALGHESLDFFFIAGRAGATPQFLPVHPPHHAQLMLPADGAGGVGKHSVETRGGDEKEVSIT